MYIKIYTYNLYVCQPFFILITMPRRTFEEAQRTRKSILDKAIEVFSVVGYEKLSLEALASAVNVTRGAIYHHFGNKERLFRESAIALLETMGATILRYARSGDSAGEDPWEALILGCEGFLVASQDAAYQRIILTEAPSILGMGEWQTLDDRYTTAPLIEVLGILAADGRLGPLNPEASARALSGAMNQLSLWSTSPEDVGTAHATVRTFLSTLTKGVISS